MVGPLSERLADLSAKAKEAEHPAVAATAETAAEIRARREHAHAAANEAVMVVACASTDAKFGTDAHAQALKAEVNGDIEIDEGEGRPASARPERSAADRAAWLDENAGWMVGTAKAAVEQAKLAVLDAEAARRGADELRTA